MQECWDDEPKKRPKFSDIASFFKEMLDEDSTVAILSIHPIISRNIASYPKKCTPRMIFLVYFIQLYISTLTMYILRLIYLYTFVLY